MCEVETVPHEDTYVCIETHRKKCSLEMIQCKYYRVGCKRVKIARKDLEEHNKQKMEEHLMMTKVHLDAALKQIANLNAQ